jgi:L-ornithine Nalpha-acyltransferase
MSMDTLTGRGGPANLKPPPREAFAPNGPPIAASGPLEVRLAFDPSDVEASQALRYRVFYEEMAAQASAEVRAAGRDFDRFDPICDHLLVLDTSAPPRPEGRPAVVGTYRLLRQEVAERNFGFYSASEYQIQPLLDRADKGLRFLELGRSCTHSDYRSKPTIELLWHGIMGYLTHHKVDVMFGCASFAGTDPDSLALPLSFLHHYCSAPPEWNVRALDHLYVEMNRLPKEQISTKESFRTLPPLIRGYVRAGGYIGEGAVIDRQFNTTDVMIIFPVSRIDPRYFTRFSRK